MKKHKIKFSDLMQWRLDARIVFAAASGPVQKRLEVDTYGKYYVSVKEKEEARFTNIHNAIEYYNEY